MNILHLLKRFHKTTYSRIFIFLVTFFLGIVTYVPGTRLIGWDNLQSDLNPTLGIVRAWWSVWEEYQSFGLMAGMAHAADLPRAVLVFLLSYVLPSDIIRYTIMMGLVTLGALGTYQLLKTLNKRYEGGYGIVGSLFYIFNFMVIQLMYVPVEPFAYFIGFLPWIMWIFLVFLREIHLTRRTILLTFGIFLVSLPFAVAQQLFVVLCLLIGLLTLGIAFEKRSLLILKRVVVFGLLLLAVHSCWILPQIYFLKTSSAVVQTAKINQLSTQDIYYRNLDKGNLKDFFTFDGFFSESLDSHGNFLFQAWKIHRENILIQIAEGLVVLFILVGLFMQKRYGLGLTIWYLLMSVMLLSDTFGFSQVNSAIRSIPLVNQMFRSPFTKFAIPYALVSAIYFTGGLYVLGSFLQKHAKWGGKVGWIVGLVLIFFISFPVWKGEYISSQMKLRLPSVYADVFTFFAQEDKNARIGLLPEYTHWGWQYNTWGYNGSGFMWYGIEQPIISRNFDMWTEKGESYYWEMKHALDIEDTDQINAVLEKYDVKYLVLDESVVPLVSSTKAISYPRLKDLLAKDTRVKKVASYNFLTVYEYDFQKSHVSYVWGTENQLPNIGPSVHVTDMDSAFATYGNYQTNSNLAYTAWYPFLDTMSKTTRSDQVWNIRESGQSFELSRGGLPKETTQQEELDTQTSDLYLEDQGVSYILPYQATASSGVVNLSVPKLLIGTYDLTQAEVTPCSKEGDMTALPVSEGLDITAKKGGYGCLSFVQSTLDQKHSYLVKVKNKNISGQRLYFYVLDTTRESTYLEDRLSSDTQYFLINPGRNTGLGYSFSFQATSYPTIPSENILSEVSIYLLPDSLQSLSYTSGNKATPTIFIQPEVAKDTYYRYLITLPKETKTIVLDQMYHEGWSLYKVKDFSLMTKLFPWMYGKKVGSHVVVNNWENGWNVESGGTYIAIFWPQYLEYIGIIIVVVAGGISLVLVRRV